MGWPAAIASCQRSTMCRAAVTMTSLNRSTSLRRKAGAHIRRCRAQISPLLVSSPSPSSGRSMASSGVVILV
jgi:hypothetical protein